MYKDRLGFQCRDEADDLRDRAAIDVDRAYVEGMRTGWNMAQGLSQTSAYFPKAKNELIEASNAEINADFDAALNARRKEIAAAKTPKHERAWTGPGYLERTGYIDPQTLAPS